MLLIASVLIVYDIQPVYYNMNYLWQSSGSFVIINFGRIEEGKDYEGTWKITHMKELLDSWVTVIPRKL